MKHTLFLFLTIALHFSCFSQELIVKDGRNGLPIELVNIVSYELNKVVTTDAQGRADLSSLAGSDSLVVSLIGYEKYLLRFSDIPLDKPLEIFLKPGTFTLDEFVVSAARWKQQKRDVPIKIVSISPQDVALSNPQTAADLLSRTGEVYVQKSQLGGGSPMIRGFATNRVMLSVDGVRMNNAIFRSGNVQNIISLDPFAIANTEVVYGPGSVIYGSDAIGGVMNFYTTSPRLSSDQSLQTSGNAAMRVASANFEKTAHLDFTLSGKKWGSFSSFSFSDFDDLVMGSHGPVEYLRSEYVITENGTDRMVANPNPRKQVPTGFSKFNLMQKIRFKPNKNWDLIYGGHYSSTSDYARYDRLLRYRGDTLRSASWYYGPQEWMMHNLKAEHVKRTRFYDKMGITAAYQYFRESRHNRDFASPILSNRVEQVHAYSINLDFEQDLGERNEIFYGAESVFNLVYSRGMDKNIATGATYGAPSRYPDGSLWNSNAVYVSDRYRWNQKMTLLGGVRYSVVRVQSTFDTSYYDLPATEADLLLDALNGSLGMAYKPTESWQFNLNLSTGFRAPNIDDLGKVFDSEPGSVVVPNANLTSEYAYNADLGITKILAEWLKIDATGFFTYLNNAMVRRPYQLNGEDSVMYFGELSRIQAVQNAAFATVYGIQAGFEARFQEGLSASSRINYQHGVEELEDGSRAPLRHAAPVFGITRLNYTRKGLKLEVNAEYNGRVRHEDMPPSELGEVYLYAKDRDGNIYSPAWYTINLRMMYAFNDAFNLTAGIENITDQRYRPFASGLSAPGRNFIIATRLAF